MSTYETVIFERDAGVATITINRPKAANTINRQLFKDMNAVLDELEDDVETQVVMLTGAGDRHFCGGADLREAGKDLGSKTMKSPGQDFISRFETIPQVVIAVINGAAMGGGCEIAIACDFRFMAAKAKIGVPEILFGALPAGGGTQRLPRIVGVARAKELVLTGRHLTAQEAENIGLITRAVAGADLMDEARAFAAHLADLPSFAVRTGKMLTGKALEMDLATGLAFERRTILNMATREEMQAAQAKAMAKNPTYDNIFSKSS
ncbi:MAG: enoyl-CoA hydratase/isomerase family protein [Gammaproteobacteria bacterium]|nr:enoyl-CoA hydratase/isomerase family protein [Gammaproteobacteria bacterium]MDD9963478.1 enoyl-CoA hydratase/isomerase family protein [Gammaproteobacteria bacterium]MDE0273836.1 enoyl-CoA hydratase/isomerase family protein [Gammaproteobacteria bacterium]